MSLFQHLESLSHLEQFKLSPILIVVDIETKSTRVRAQICSIGAVAINVFTGEIVGSFYERTSIKGQENRIADSSTMEFWLQQKSLYPISYREVFSNTLSRMELPDALVMLNRFIKSVGGERPSVIGNGSEFDNAIILDACDQFNVEVCWDYGRNQSLRTVTLFSRLFLNYDPIKEIEFTGHKHHALDDAMYEARCLSAVMRHFKSHFSAVSQVSELLEAIKDASSIDMANQSAEKAFSLLNQLQGA